MKRTKLNLLANRIDYQKWENLFRLIRYATLGMGIIVVLSTVVFTIFLLIQSARIQNMLIQKNTLLNTLKEKENIQAKLFLLQAKGTQLDKFLNDDAHSLPYYNLLNTALAKSTESASLKSFTIQKNRNTDFTVAFVNFSELLNFFRFTESEEFLNNFEKVSLKSFSAIGETKQKENYELTFSGKFIEIHENNN